jgi:arylsulfatase
LGHVVFSSARHRITSNTYYDWLLSNPSGLVIGPATVSTFLATFKEYPPSQRAATFTIDQAVEKMRQNLGGQ